MYRRIFKHSISYVVAPIEALCFMFSSLVFDGLHNGINISSAVFALLVIKNCDYKVNMNLL